MKDRYMPVFEDSISYLRPDLQTAAWVATMRPLSHPNIQSDLDTRAQALGSLPISHAANHGISHIHFQSTGEKPDQGMLVESVHAEVRP
jgi:hypothetical protein